MHPRAHRAPRVRGDCPPAPGRAAGTATLAALAALFLLAGCGSDEGGATSAEPDRPGGSVSVPDLPVNDDPSAVQCTGPPRGVFDATAIVGDSIAAAKRAAAKRGCSVRVAVRDGTSLPLTQDFRPDRVNVAVEHGTVTEILDLG